MLLGRGSGRATSFSSAVSDRLLFRWGILLVLKDALAVLVVGRSSGAAPARSSALLVLHPFILDSTYRNIVVHEVLFKFNVPFLSSALPDGRSFGR